MSAKFTDAVRSLERARESAKRRLDELDQERTDIKASLKSLDAALKTLQVTDTRSSGPAKQAPTTAQVIELVSDFLSDGSSHSITELERHVGDRLLAEGNSRAGLKLRLVQAMKNQSFVKAGSKFELRHDRLDDHSNEASE